MTENPERGERRSAAVVFGRAEQLQQRAREVAGHIAETKEYAAGVLDQCTEVRPHAADRLHDAAEHARDFAQTERRADEGIDRVGPGHQHAQPLPDTS